MSLLKCSVFFRKLKDGLTTKIKKGREEYSLPEHETLRNEFENKAKCPIRFSILWYLGSHPVVFNWIISVFFSWPNL